jgi:ketosteroid isomerase-like protein
VVGGVTDEAGGAGVPPDEAEPATAEAAVRATLHRFWAGWERLDVDAVLATLLADESLTFIGTDAGEYWQGHQAVVGPFRAMASAFVEERVCWFPGDPRVEVSGDLAWASGRLRTVVVRLDGSPTEADVRTTYVLRRVGDGWRIAQAHVSVAPEAPVAAY